MHVVSISRRTDIPAFYPDWLMNRLRAGYCRVPNPFGGQVYTVSLRPEDVLCLVFWTKNPRPLLPHLDEIEAMGHRYYVHFTINGYDHVFERAVLPPERAVVTFQELAARIGPELVQWRYDPIVETDLTDWRWHVANFTRLCESLANHTRRCYFSFVQLYRKTRRRLDELAVQHGFRYRFYPYVEEQTRYSQHGVPMSLSEMQEQAQELAALARPFGITLYTCCCDALIAPEQNIERAHCVDADLVMKAASGELVSWRGGGVVGCNSPSHELTTSPSHELTTSPPHHLTTSLKLKATRQDCGCFESKDIGVYDTCPHGCGASYCYAVRNHQRAMANRKAHDPTSEFLHWPYAEPPEPLNDEAVEEEGEQLQFSL